MRLCLNFAQQIKCWYSFSARLLLNGTIVEFANHIKQKFELKDEKSFGIHLRLDNAELFPFQSVEELLREGDQVDVVNGKGKLIDLIDIPVKTKRVHPREENEAEEAQLKRPKYLSRPVSSERLTSRIQAAYDPEDYIPLLPPSHSSTSVLAREFKGFVEDESVEQGESFEDDYYYPGSMTRKRYVDVETDYSD